MTTATLTDAAGQADPREGSLMNAKHGDLALLSHPVAQELLQSRLPMRLTYIARDGTPRVVAVLFHWTGEEIVFTSWPDDPKVAALRAQPQVALTIDTNEPPFKVLSIRGAARATIADSVPSECLPTFSRYYGPEEGRAWVERMARMTDRIARIAIRPTWVNVFDFETRFPRGMAKRMG